MKKEDLSLKLLNAILKEQKKQTKIIQSIKDSFAQSEYGTQEAKEEDGVDS